MDVSLYKARTAEIVINPMLEFIEDYDAEGYTKEDVQKCELLIHTYLDALAGMETPTND